MAFDGIVNYLITQELKNHIIGGKIDKIFEPNSNEILLGIYSNGFKYALNIVVSPSNYRICLTNSTKPNPAFAPNFCMVLRKHLLNTRVVSINTLSLERIVIIEFEGRSKSEDIENKKLVVELMGKHSNIILVNSENIIIDSLKHFSTADNSYRNILPNHKYLFPISNKLDFLEIKSSTEFYNRTLDFAKNIDISSNIKLSNIISDNYTGISRSSASFILQTLQIDNSISKENMDQFYNYLCGIVNNPSYTILQPFSSKDYSITLQNTEKENSLQINNFIDDYYSQKEISELFIAHKNNLSKLILNYMKKLNNKLTNINRKLEECKNTDLYRLYGELITSNLYRISHEHLNEISLENYYDNNNLTTIPLDKSISPTINAKNYFKKYNKLKNAKAIVELQKKEVESEIDYIESIIYEFELATTISDIDNIYNEFTENFLNISALPNNDKKLSNKKKDIRTSNQIGEPIKYIIDSFNVIVGKNNKQNDYITKHADSNDIWFHTKDIHGSHVILKTNGKFPSQGTINKCASLAAHHSKAIQSSNVPVDYTFVKYVKKPSNAKPGMVIYTNHKNVIVKPCNTF